MKAGHSLPLLSAWVLAVVLLAGLIYWGVGPEGTAPSKSQPPAAQSKGKTGKTAEPQKKASADPPVTLPLARSTPAGEATIPSPARRPQPPPETAAHEEASPPPPRPAPQEEKEQVVSLHDHSGVLTKPPLPQPPPPPISPYLAKIAIVIDDFGLDLEVAKKFLKIPLPLTFSILPHQKYSREIAELAYSHHHEVILHLPMQPQGYPMKNPGKGALLTSMSHELLKKAISSALEVSPHFTGVNNHMGSRFTEDRHGMHVFLRELKEKGLYFLDSSTSPRSVGLALAEELQVPTAKRDIFLDHVPTEDFVRSQIATLIRKARTEGKAVAIGHPYDVTLKVLTQEANRFRDEGVAVLSAGELITRNGSTARVR
ncbi:MAG: hypothetical protein GX443_12310 [Deltaproteobacteria bacterium]|nr:hypothetical protein [Deltaproteobacteria bacterium]